MSEESKKIEKIEQEAKQDVKEVKPTELSEQELDKVAGGRAVKQSGIGAVVANITGGWDLTANKSN